MGINGVISFVSQWASHIDPSASVKIDISSAAKGNISIDDYSTDRDCTLLLKLDVKAYFMLRGAMIPG